MHSWKKKYVAEFVAQLKRPRFCTVQVARQDLRIDYRIVRIESLHRHSIPFVPVTGLGSGWEGIASLAFELACEGYEIVLLSLPGYGSSEDPKSAFYRHNLFVNCADTVLAFMRKRGIQLAYFVGHSMGAEIVAQAAKMFPPVCRGLVLLSPSGLYTLSCWEKLGLIWKFPASGLAMQREYEKIIKSSDEVDYLAPLITLCGQQKSPWRPGRLWQRTAEFLALGKGSLAETLPFVQCPVSLVVGSRDTVFPTAKCHEALENILGLGQFCEEVIEGGYHNMTLSLSVRPCAKGILLCLRNF